MGDRTPQVDRPRQRGRRRAPVPLVVAALSLVVSAVRMPWPSSWLDEAATVTMATRPLGRLWDTLGTIDLVHGAYYLLMHPWVSLVGTSEVALRTPSAVASALCCGGLALLVHEVSGRRAAWVAGVACALLPGLAWAGIDARSYAFVAAAVVWGMWALHRALTSSGRRWWVLFVALAVGAVLLNVMAVLMVVPHLVAAHRAGRLRPALLAQGVVLVLVAPFVLLTRAQVGQVSWIDLSPGRLVNSVVVGQLFVGQRREATPLLVLAGLLLAAVFVVLLVAALRNRADQRFAVDTALAWLVFPTLAVALPVLGGVQLYQERYVAFTVPAACWLAGLGAARLALRTWSVRAGAVVAVLACAVNLTAQAGEAAKDGYDYRALAALAPGNDAVVFATDEARGIADAYPQQFVGVRDLAERASGPDSGTLWGTQLPIPDLVLQGRVVVYVDSDPDEAGRRATEALVERDGCRELDRVVRDHWTGITYACG